MTPRQVQRGSHDKRAVAGGSAPHCALHHAHLLAAELDESIRFYREMLGADLVFHIGVAGIRNVVLRFGTGHLQSYDQPPRDSGRGAGIAPGS